MRLRLRFAITDENCSYIQFYILITQRSLLLHKKLHATIIKRIGRKGEKYSNLPSTVRHVLKWVLRGNIL